MRSSGPVAAVLLVFATLAPASAAPQATVPIAADGLVIQVSGCHREPERHFVEEFGRRAWHIHRGSRCRPVEVRLDDDEEFDEPRRRDCHRDAERHFLPEYGGSFVHRHVGPNCRVRELRRSEERRSGTCIQIGPLTYCE